MQWDIVDNLFTLSEVCTQLIRSFGVFKGKLFPTQIFTDIAIPLFQEMSQLMIGQWTEFPGMGKHSSTSI